MVLANPKHCTACVVFMFFRRIKRSVATEISC